MGSYIDQNKRCRVRLEDFSGITFYVGGIGDAWNPPAETIQRTKQFPKINLFRFSIHLYYKYDLNDNYM